MMRPSRNVGQYARPMRDVGIASGREPEVYRRDGASNLYNLEVSGVSHREFVTRRVVYQVIRRELALGYGDPLPVEDAHPRLVPIK